MKYDAIIFDLDGVICSTDEYHYQAWKKVADSLKIPFDHSINNRLRGVSRMESLDIILENYDGELSLPEKNELAEQKNEIYKSYLEELSEKDLLSGVEETLEELRKNHFLLAIGSSSKNTPFILKQLGLSDFFDAISDGNHITHSKPHPEVFLKAAVMLCVEPERCLVVEDAVSGVMAGHAAGMEVACVGDASDAEAGDYNLKHISELLQVVGGFVYA